MTTPPDQPTPGDPLQPAGGDPPPPPPPQPGQPAPPTAPPGYGAAPAQPPGYTAPLAQAQPSQPPLAITGLVLGILTIVLFLFCWFVSVPIGIAGVICSILGRNQAREQGLPTGMATAGLICSIVGLLLSVLAALLIGAIIVGTDSNN
jgi:hypothetical protein